MVKPRSQFELIAELSHELTSIAHDVNLVATEPSFLAQRLLRIVIKDAHVFTAIQGLMIVDSLTRRSPVNGHLLGGVDVPGTIEEIPCGIDGPMRPATSQGASATMSASRCRAVAELHDQVEAWVNEGGAGDDATQ